MAALIGSMIAKAENSAMASVRSRSSVSLSPSADILRICSSLIVWAAFATCHEYRRHADMRVESEAIPDGAAQVRSVFESGNDPWGSH